MQTGQQQNENPVDNQDTKVKPVRDLGALTESKSCARRNPVTTWHILYMDGLLLGWDVCVVSGCAMLLWNVVTPKVCSHCGGTHFATAPLNVEVQQVAQFVANPIEIVEYHRHYNQCTRCGTSCAADWSQEMIPGQDLGVRLQALIGWLGNYGHMPYAKIRELLLELGQIDIGEGTLVATNERVAQAIEPPVEALGNKIPTQSWATFIPQTN
jgi:hypothetical protein